jgi:branched-chain amino acid transport system substrate-binding protein
VQKNSPQSDATPFRIGYCLSLTGPIAGNSRSAALAHDIWVEDINRQGGLLGRPVELICYDDQAQASNVAALYERLISVDKVDLVIGGYGTNTLRAALPLVMQRQRFFIGLMGLGANDGFAYPDYFAMIPTGTDPNAALTEGFFELAARQTPRPARVAIVAADAEFAVHPVQGARANADKYGFEIVHEATYPLTTADFKPIIDAVAASGCDLLFLCSYLNDSIELVRAIHAHPFRPKMVGGAMIGPQNTAVKNTLGPLLNGFVNYEYWQPVPAMMFAGVQQFLNTYQARAAREDVDLLGHYMAPLAYAQMQVLAQAVEATGGIDDAALAAYARGATFDTVMGAVRFGKNGEWAQPRVLQVQFRGIDGHAVEQFRDGARQVVVAPSGLSSGELVYPYADAVSRDPGALMQANLTRVFGEHDPARRIEAIRELYHEDAMLHEPQNSVQGHEAISQAVTELLAHLPAGFVFSAIRPALGHHAVGRLQWRAGPAGGPAAVTGTDVAHIDGGLIRSLHVFLDQPDG